VSNNVRSLLLGHHQDDNVEMVLMRLAQGHRGMGLKGVADVARIPECHGMYGICESGDIADFKDIKPRAIDDFV
jgi:WD repeat-containing protein 48